MKLDLLSCLVCLSVTAHATATKSSSKRSHAKAASVSLTDIVLPEYQEPIPTLTLVDGPIASYFHKSTKTMYLVNYGGVLSKVLDGTTTPITIATGMSELMGVCIDPSGNIYASSRNFNTIYKYNSAGVLLGTTTGWSYPYSIFCDSSGNVFIPDRNNHRVSKQSSTGVISHVAGSTTGVAGSADGDVSVATMTWPMAVAVNAAGDVFFAEHMAARVRMVKNSIVSTIAGGGSSGILPVGPAGGLAKSYSLSELWGLWVSDQGDVYIVESGPRRRVNMLKKDVNGGYTNSYMYVIAGADRKSSLALVRATTVTGDDAGSIFVCDNSARTVLTLYDPNYASSAALPTAAPSTAPSTSPSTAPSVKPTAAPSVTPSASPSTAPSATPSSIPTQAPSLAVPEYSLTISAKSFKYFEVRVFTEANERVFPVSYDLVDCPENAEAVIWGHESTPVTEDTNTCVFGLPRHYWCECPALTNGNKPKLTLNFGGTVFDRVELLILDWVDGELTVSDSANNIVLFTASRAGGFLAGEEFVGYDHLNLLQVAPSVVPTVAPSSVPTTKPSWTPTAKPSIPSVVPTQTPTMAPTTTAPSAVPSVTPSIVPSAAPSFTAQYTITLTAKTFKYFEVRVYTHDNLRIFPVSYELEHCPENAGVAVWNDQTTEDTNTCVYGYPRNFWCQCSAVADEKPKLVLHMGHTVFDRVELLLLNWEDGEVTVTDEANHETFLSATHDGVGNEFVTFGNLNLEHAAAPARKLLRGA